MKPIQIVGMGLGPDDLTSRHKSIIDGAQVLAGGKRLLDWFSDHRAERLELQRGLTDWLEAVARRAQADRRVVVLASGDPGFFGVAARLAQAVGADNLRVHPNVSAVQAAFARLGQSWQEARVVTLHGRDKNNLWAALASGSKVAVYTDPHNTPNLIAAMMLDRGLDQWRMWVLENMGGPEERVGDYSLEKVGDREYSPLNLVVLKRLREPERLHLGLAEAGFEHEAGLITKSEVRAVALAKLELGPGQCLWDLGAGCGSVGLEATLLVPGGRVIAVERRARRAEQIKANRRRYQAAALEVVRGELPGVLAQLPDPDRVFIGGGGDALSAIIQASTARLPRDGVISAALVRLDSLERARRAMVQAELRVSVTQVAVSRGSDLSGSIMMKALNPVWLVTGKKEAQK